MRNDVSMSQKAYFKSENFGWPKMESRLFAVFENVSLISLGSEKIA